MINKKLQSGFALLMTIIVIGVVVSVGLSLASLTTKQLNLSTNSKESETAFHAANAGVECAQYLRYNHMDEVEVGDDLDFSCFGGSGSAVSAISPTLTSASNVDLFLYKKDFTWAGGSRCSDISMLIIVSNDEDDKGMVDVDDIKSIFPGYPDGDEFVCEVGGRCAIISAEGYSSSCDKKGNIGVVQREVLITS